MIRYVSEDRGDNMEDHVEKFILQRRLSDGHLLHHLEIFHVALVVCSDNNIYDHEIYSRHLLPAKFDENQSSLAFVPDKNGKPLLTYKKCFLKDTSDIIEELPGIPEEIIDEHLFSGVDEYGISVYGLLLINQENGQVKEIHIPMYSYANILLSPSIKATLEVDAHLAGCIFCEMNRSRRFRKRFLNYVRRLKCFKRCADIKDLCEENDDLTAALDLPCLIELHLIWPKQKIDYAWDYRICGEIAKRVNLEENMAWLNTLGGGYGALGDYFTHHALKAGQIARKQLQISLELGDQISAAKCRLFFAQSLLQCGYLRQCKYIVRSQYRFARGHRVRDEKLEAMCHSLWNRLKYLWSLHKNNKLVRNTAEKPCIT